MADTENNSFSGSVDLYCYLQYSMVEFLNTLLESDITRTVVDVPNRRIGDFEFADRLRTERISDSGLPSYQTRTV